MIIGISGYIGSGKDTVAKIMQYLDQHYDGSFEEWDRSSNFHKAVYDKKGKWQLRKWAGKLKEVATLLTGIPVENFEDQEFKKTEMGAMWGMSVREFLQKLGTEGLRDGLHKNVWVNALMSEYKIGKEGCPNWIISDTRFPNEAQAIKDVGGIVIRVNREAALQAPENPLFKRARMHPSETALEYWEFDEVIDNNGTIEDLIPKVKEIMERRNLL